MMTSFTYCNVTKVLTTEGTLVDTAPIILQTVQMIELHVEKGASGK